MKTVKIHKVLCKRCSYEWSPRIEQPKECPNCKSLNWSTPKKPLAVKK